MLSLSYIIHRSIERLTFGSDEKFLKSIIAIIMEKKIFLDIIF